MPKSSDTWIPQPGDTIISTGSTAYTLCFYRARSGKLPRSERVVFTTCSLFVLAQLNIEQTRLDWPASSIAGSRLKNIEGHAQTLWLPQDGPVIVAMITVIDCFGNFLPVMTSGEIIAFPWAWATGTNFANASWSRLSETGD